VRDAISKGIEHLRHGQMIEDSGPLPGASARIREAMEDIDYAEAAAVTWVLRRAGAPADDPALGRASKVLATREPKGPEEVALVVLGLTTAPLPSGDPFAIASASSSAAKTTIAPAERATLQRLVARLLESQASPDDLSRLLPDTDSSGGWSSIESFTKRRFETGDVPATYLALLALESASRAGVVAPGKAYLAALGFLLRAQMPKGPAMSLKMNQVEGKDRFEWSESAKARGFGWTPGLSDDPTGYDTAGAIVGLEICQDALWKDKAFTPDLKKRTRTAIRDGLAWIQTHYDIAKNPITESNKRKVEGPLYHHHWLQALARLEIHSRMRFVGPHDWYQEGAKILVDSQTADGSWDAIWWENCYALLFLMRASLESVTPPTTDPSR
jgi:hypothetical protein